MNGRYVASKNKFKENEVDWRGRVAESPAERPATAQAATGRAPALPALKRSGSAISISLPKFTFIILAKNS